MPRYRIDIEYDGTDYAGWQLQRGQATIQGAIEKAIASFSSESVRVNGAGRTDAGVHALCQSAHFDLTRDWPAQTIVNALNAHLALADERVAILAAFRVADDFHARFTATARHYLYRILNRRAPATLDMNRVWAISRPLDAQAMHIAAQSLLGTHDFTTFRSAHCQAKNPVRTLDSLDVRQVGDLIEIQASARSFLHNQVRSLAGTLKLVGEGKWGPEDVTAALAARDRIACGPVAPAAGLYLVRVDYSPAEAENQ